nr:phospholipase D-like domain-containing protein [uncultured Psychrobacter sp.]
MAKLAILVAVTAPTQRHDNTPQFLGALISQAQHTLIISTPYFVPDYSLVSILCATAYRGVAVTMIFPKKMTPLSLPPPVTVIIGNCLRLV